MTGRRRWNKTEGSTMSSWPTADNKYCSKKSGEGKRKQGSCTFFSARVKIPNSLNIQKKTKTSRANREKNNTSEMHVAPQISQ